MKQATVRSHYLPKTYLRHFMYGNKLFMYKKGERFFKEEVPFDKRIIEIIGEDGLNAVGVKNNLYNPNIDGITSDDLEEIFREYGEDFYNDLVKSIEELTDNSIIPDNIKDRLCIFMAAMRVRTPQFKWEIEELNSTFLKHEMAQKIGSMKTEDIVSFYKNETGKDVALELAEEIKESFKEKKYNLKYPNAHFIKNAIMSLEMHADIFHEMTMTIVKSKERFFVTSDNPVVFFVPREKVDFYNSPRSLVSPYTEVFFAISKNIGVTLNRRKMKQETSQVSRKIVEIFNENITHNSFDFLFSPIEMHALEKFIKEYIPYPFRLTIH